ncbi:PDDEXK-like family protein [Pseudomonas japonica]|uniref:PDDEXK-like family protein n=1 Tax=Pseudomonas japonica TaxID=256466 RepID=UPI0015E4193C|nr:PD-(D/E)XK nuclease family protein [Pseudomonas japonica]MBA1245260.1 PD-(D/E)XK nuclease family protein [Pseudomonas japonica]
MDAAAQVASLTASQEFTSLKDYTQAFDLFRVMGVSNKELVHSNIIASLLNDRGTHSLGSAFRDAYVRSLVNCRHSNTGVPEQVFEAAAGTPAVVARELQYMDVLIDFPSIGLVIAIENKIHALDQHEQVLGYQQALCGLFPHYKHRLVVYLTPKGRDSPTADHEHSVPVYYQSYGQLAHLLRQQQTRTSGAVREFLEQFATHIEKTMTGSSELKQLCWQLFDQNQDAYELLQDHYAYCLGRKLDEKFSYLQTQLLEGELFSPWRGIVEIKLVRDKEKDKQHYSLDVRLEGWPSGLCVKIYKHTWLGVFPYFNKRDLPAINERLPVFTSPARPVPDFPDLYLASSRYHVKHERKVCPQGNKATPDDLNLALAKARECIVEIESALAPSELVANISAPGTEIS